MLEQTKPYVEKVQSVDAEIAGHAYKRDVKLQGRGCVGVAFFCLLCLCLPSLTTL